MLLPLCTQLRSYLEPARIFFEYLSNSNKIAIQTRDHWVGCGIVVIPVIFKELEVREVGDYAYIGLLITSDPARYLSFRYKESEIVPAGVFLQGGS